MYLARNSIFAKQKCTKSSGVSVIKTDIMCELNYKFQISNKNKQNKLQLSSLNYNKKFYIDLS